MQQSFESHILQSNLTDCSNHNRNDPLVALATSASRNPHPTTVSRLIPLLLLIPPILCTIILFIWSFLITSAWLHVTLTITPPFTQQPAYSMDKNTYNLSIQRSLHELWYSKSYGIALLVLLLSFVFPILKLLYILFLVLSHAFIDKRLCIKLIPNVLSPHRAIHSRILFILEALNKYSFMNVFVLIILMSCIYLNINGDIDIYDNFTSFHLCSLIIIEPFTGIVIFGAAMLISCALTVFIQYRYIPFYSLPHTSAQFDVESHFDQIIQNTKAKSLPPALNYRYNEPQSPLLFSKNYSFRSFCVKMMGFVFFVFVVVGAITLFIAQIAIIEIEYVGGLSPYMHHPSAQRMYSLDAIVQSVDEENDNGSTKFLRILYELFGIVLPLITILLLTLLWLIPMPKWIHIRLKGVIWCTHMLNAVDVIIVSCVLVSRELPQMFEYIMKHQRTQFCQSLFIQAGNPALCQSTKLYIRLHDGVWVAIAFYVSLWIVVVYSVHFSEDDYSPEQLRKLKVKIKKKQREDEGGAMFDTIHENKTL